MPLVLMQPFSCATPLSMRVIRSLETLLSILRPLLIKVYC